MRMSEMINVADQNGKTYISPYGTYSKEDGFNLYPTYDFEQLLNKLVHEDCWKLKVDKKKMTKADIEKELGYEIDIICENKKYHSVNELLKEMFEGGMLR